MAKTEKVFLGPRLRRLRTGLGLTQARMASELGISASYLNLMERGQRSVSAKVLLRLSDTYDLELSELTSGTDQQLVGALHDALRDPALGSAGVPKDEVEDVVGASPATARALVALHERLTALTRRLVRDEGDEALAALGASAPPADRVRDWLQSRRNYFDGLDRAAEALHQALALHRVEPLTALGARMRDAHGTVVRVLAPNVMADMLRYWDPHNRQLRLSELLPAASRRFQIGFQLALLEQGAEIDALIAGSPLAGTDAERLGRTTLASYFAAALLMPYGRFHAAAESLRYDVDALAYRFGTSPEQVAHRLTTLSRPEARGVPFFFLRIDRAGNISKRYSPGRFVFPRFGGVCPRWDIHAAHACPDGPTVQEVQTVDGARYLTVAFRVSRSGATLARPAQRFAIALGCDIAHAPRLVYADLAGGEPTPIGPNCYLCERAACPARAHPPLGRSAAHDERRRGLAAVVLQPE